MERVSVQCCFHCQIDSPLVVSYSTSIDTIIYLFILFINKSKRCYKRIYKRF